MKRKTVNKMDAGGSGKASKEKRGSSDEPRDSTYLLHSIIQGFSISAFVIGKDHKILYWNRALEQLSKIPMSKVVGTNQQWRAFYAEPQALHGGPLGRRCGGQSPEMVRGQVQQIGSPG